MPIRSPVTKSTADTPSRRQHADGDDQGGDGTRTRLRAKVLAVPSFRRYFLARTLSRAGDAMFPIGFTAAMLQSGYGATEVGLVLAAAMAPAVVFMLIGGVLADHFQSRFLMVSADLVRLVVQGLLAAAFFLGRSEMGLMIVLALLTGMAGAVFQPGAASLVTRLAPGALAEANAVLKVWQSVVVLAGPGIAGGIIAVVGAPAVIAVDSLTFGASAALLAFLRMPAAARPAGTPRVWRDLVQGWREFAARPWMWSVICVYAVLGLTVFGPFHVLSATELTDRFGAPAFGVLMSVHGAGAVLGGMLALRWRPARPLYAGALTMLGFAPMLAAIGLRAPLVPLAALMCLAGVGSAFWGVVWATAVQTHSPPEALSRLHAYDVVGSTGLIPAGRGIAGPAAAAFGSSAVLLGSSVIVLLGCALLLAIPAVSRLPAHREEQGPT